MAPINILIVGVEKELFGIDKAMEACKTRVPGGMRLFSATKALEAVTLIKTIVTQHGTCHGVLLSHSFTARGKEEYSDAIKKLLRQHYSSVPIVCWGNPRKGGEKGKDYDIALEWKMADGCAPLVALLTKIKGGEVNTGSPRNSVDESSARRSSIDAQRRTSVDESSKKVTRPSNGGIKAPVRQSLDVPFNSTVRRISLSGNNSFNSPRAGSFDMAMNPATGLRNSMDMSRLGMSAMGGMAMPMGDMTPMTAAQPQYMSAGGMAMQNIGFTPAHVGSADGEASNAELIKALADEVTRLKLLVEEKREKKRLSMTGTVPTDASGLISSGMAV